MTRATRRSVVVTEHRTAAAVELTQPEVATLRSYSKYLQLTPAQLAGHYDLTATSWIGAISVGSLDIEIRPKVLPDRILFLISYALDPDGWRDQPFLYEADLTLFEAMIPAFVRLVRQALCRGVLRGYRSEESALQTVRGRVRFEEQVRKRFGRFPPAEVMYDQYTEDILENRLLKAAIERLGRMRLRSSAMRRMLRSFRSTLYGVSLVQYHPQSVPVVSFNRINQHYRPAVELARLIIGSTSFRLRHGTLRSWAFLIDMNRVFEDFVVVALREALGATRSSFPQGARGRRVRLDDAGRIRLQPDISWWDGDRCVFVGDVKYKRVELSGFKHNDVYQVLAYTVATALPCGLLIYAAGEAEAAAHVIANANKLIEVHTLDLTMAPNALLDQIAKLATRICQVTGSERTNRSNVAVRAAVSS